MNIANNAATESGARTSVLLVDDNAVLLRTVKDLLNDKYDVTIAVSASQAFMAITKKLPDIILLDYEMPYTNGAQVLLKLRNHPDTRHIPVIFFTSSAEREVVEKLLQLKPDGYMLKPPAKEKLIEKIERTLHPENFTEEPKDDSKETEDIKEEAENRE